MADSAEGAVVRLVREHLYLAEPTVFLLGFAEGIPVLSLLVPSSALFLGLGTVHAQLGGTFMQLWLAASLGAVLGDLATYAIGRIFKHRTAELWPFSRNPEWLPRGRALMERWGIMAVLGGKFLGFLRPFIPVIAGIVEMPPFRFLLASILSSLAWAGVFLAPGYGISLLWK